MNYKILIIDDQHSDVDRINGYANLAESIERKHPTFKIELDYLTQPSEAALIEKLTENEYSGIITDAVLTGPNWAGSGFRVDNVVEVVGDRYPVAIISSRWDEANAEDISKAWRLPSCNTFLHWRDIGPHGSGQIDYAIESVMKMLYGSSDYLRPTHLQSNDDIRIIHISDLHLGGVSQDALLTESNEVAESILDFWGDPKPTFIVFTGDITEHACPMQYKSGVEWLQNFYSMLDIDGAMKDTFFYVPGNHDINIYLAASSRLQLKEKSKATVERFKLDTDVKNSELLRFAYKPFLDFFRSVSSQNFLESNTSYDDFAWVDSRFKHLGLLFYGLNSARPVDGKNMPGRCVRDDALTEIYKKINESSKMMGAKPFVIGLGHHSPVPVNGPNESVENTDAFQRIFSKDGATHLFMHGHSHDGAIIDYSVGQRHVGISRAPTLAKAERGRPKDTLRGFNLFDLRREKGQIVGIRGTRFGLDQQVIRELDRTDWELCDGKIRHLS